MSKVRALALYDFQPSADIELALKPGDIIVVNKKNAGDGWCEGELNGKRGLFPKSFVRIITFGKQGDDSDDDNGDESSDNPSPATPTQSMTSSLTLTSTPINNSSPSKTPLTPMSNKKMFMETLLTPMPDTIKKVYDRDKVKELFTDDQESITIGTGPQWMNRPPELTIAVQENVKGVRSSGVKLQRSYDVSTKELKVSVIRKYKNFLSLYDQLADKFPCISLPPLPIKQAQLVKNGPGFVEAQRRGLERFLNRVSKHPVLGCTRLFHLFLTAIDEKEWRIGTGKHSTLIRSGGGKSKKLLSSPIYHSIQYPPYNVPINQLASFDKFSKFTNILEVNLGNMQKACEALKNMHAQMSNCLRSFGKDIQNLAEGADQPSLGARYRKPSQGVVSLPNSHNILPLATTNTEVDIDSEEEDEGTGMEQVGEWNWREDETFTLVMTKLHDLSSCIRQLSQRSRRHQDQLTKGVIEALEEYSSIVHTLPVLVKLHDDAMALYNESKQKGSKTEAEDVRQDCETLNNILLAEFDYFSHKLIDDLQKIILLLMKEEAEYHKKMASDWLNMYTTYSENKPIRRTTLKRSTTLPGTVDDTITSASPPVPHRPSSSDVNKVDVSPSAVRRHYVNLSVAPTKKTRKDQEDPVYANIQVRKSEGETSTSPTYENWSPAKGKVLSNETKGRPKLDPKQFNPSNSLILNKPVPPPLVVKRHELKDDQAEAQRIGNKTDSFIVPTIPDNHSNYTFVTLGKPTTKEDTANERKSTEAVISPTGSSSTDIDEEDDGMSESRRSTLTPEDVKKNSKQTNGSHLKDSITRAATKEESGRESETSYTTTMSKLAKLTQLPVTPGGRKDGSNTSASHHADSSSVSTKQKKSFSYHNSGSINKLQTTPSRSKGLGSLKINSNSFDKSDSGHHSELSRKLTKQRQKVEKQLSCDTDGSETTGLSRIDGLLSKDDLSKFGITEDETSGSFVV